MVTRRLTGLPNGGRNVVLEISQETINAAVHRDSSHCVIADAIRSTIPQARRISVDLQTIRFTVGDKRYVFLTPAPGQVCIVRFDQGLHPTPFLLHLGRPIQIVKAGARARAREQAPGAVGAMPSKGRNSREPRRVVNAGGKGGTSITIRGGKTPPTAALSDTRGRRRTFGLKTLRP